MGLSPVGGAVSHGAGLAVATGHDRPDRIVMLPMDLQLQITPLIGHPGLTQGAGHCHLAAVSPGQQQHPSLVVGARVIEVATATGLGKAIQIDKVLEGALGGGERLHLARPVFKLCLFAEGGPADAG